MKQGKAVFHKDGRLEIFGMNDQFVCAGIIGATGNSPMFNFAVSLMKHHGDWPQDLPCNKTVELYNPADKEQA